jgi:hypothetical protein
MQTILSSDWNIIGNCSRNVSTSHEIASVASQVIVSVYIWRDDVCAGKFNFEQIKGL